jgi:membrane fusion protein (multidrug efflux system)
MIRNITPVFAALIVVFSLFACGGSEPQAGDRLALEARRDSLKEAIGALNDELASLETEIAELSDDFSLLNVTAFTTSAGQYMHYFTVQGNVETDLNAMVYPETQGIVKSIMVTEGQQVSKGQALLVLDNALIQRNIDEVETQYRLAKDIYERQARLWDQKIGSEVQFLEAKTNKERLENTISTLKQQLSMSTVRAPFSGMVDKINPRIGEMASPAMPVLRIISLENMYVSAQVSENYLAVVKPAMPVEVLLSSGDTITAEVKRVGRFINPENRTFDLTVDLKETANVRPNMFCALRVNDLALDSVVVIRSSMVQQDPQNREYVYVLEPNEDHYLVRKQLITTGSSYGDFSWISAGLQPGMMLVDKGARRVIEDQAVSLVQTNAQN